jgi:4-hydroxybenzoate polyprenyltransferase
VSRGGRVGSVRALALACHPGPTLAVTLLTGLLAWSSALPWGRGLLVTAAVLTGQLSIGWSNDLVDAQRDRLVGRTDKPLASGDITPRAVRAAAVTVLAATLVLSLACGAASGIAHLGLVVGSGWAYNLWLKRSVLSPLPYAVAFGSLPAVVTLALPVAVLPPAWVIVTGALLGIGAHLLNALPDLADDEATGVRALPHVLGGRVVRWLAPAVLLVGSAVAAYGPGIDALGGLLLLACVLLAFVAVRGRGRLPFVAAIGIALANAAGLIVR